MKILLLADSNSPHILKWAKSINKSGCSVSIFTLHTPDKSLYNDSPDIKIFSINASRDLQTRNEINVSKLIYLKAVKKVKEIIKEIKPDIIHAHYASSYGLIGALVGFHPYIISVWGADIYSFPNYSLLNRAIIKYNMSKADKILSTSQVMKNEINKYFDGEVIITPFGIDTKIFFPKKGRALFNENDIVIGTVKTLEKKYGIEYLIKAFSIVKNKLTGKSLKLLIVGNGTQLKYLKNLITELNIENDTVFTGYINHNLVQDYHNMLDISISVSIDDSESFGVAVLEASACGKPVIVSNVGGLPEVVEHNKTGFVVEKKNVEAIVNAIEKLIRSPVLRIEMGSNGRQKVLNEYEWTDCVKKMVTIYDEIVK